MALFKCDKKWTFVDCSANPIHINTTTGEQTYVPSKPMRNMTIVSRQVGMWTRRTAGTGTDCNAQIGYGLSNGEGSGANVFNSFWEESAWQYGGSVTSNKTYVLSDNVKYKKIITGPWCAAFGGGGEYNASVTLSDIWITSYEELR